MSIWDAFIDDYEHRRKNLLKRIQLMEARLLRTGNSELGRWITTTADSLGQAKKDLASDYSKRPKPSFDQRINRPAALKFSPLTVSNKLAISARSQMGFCVAGLD